MKMFTAIALAVLMAVTPAVSQEAPKTDTTPCRAEAIMGWDDVLFLFVMGFVASYGLLGIYEDHEKKKEDIRDLQWEAAQCRAERLKQ